MADLADMLGKLSGKKKKDPIHIKSSHKGLLHEKLGVPKGEKIPAKKLSKAEKSSSPKEREEANFAKNAKKWKKG